MSDFHDLTDAIVRIEQRLTDLGNRVDRMIVRGPVMESEHGKGVRIQLAPDEEGGKPHLSWWLPYADRSGSSTYLPRVGEQVVAFAPHGDLRQATVISHGHSDDKPNPAADGDETVHHNRDGQNNRVKKGAVTDQADKTHKRWVGQDPGEGNLVHELNKQLAGLRAGLTQAEHNIAGLHDATSQLRQVLEFRNPEVKALIPLLNGDAKSLDAAVKGVTGKLQDYLGSTVKRAVDKLTNSLLGGLMGVITGAMNGQIGGLISQAADLVQTSGLEGAAHAAASGLVDEMQGLAANATGGVAAEIEGRLGQLEGLLAGTPVAGALGDLRAQITGALGDIAQTMGGLGDMLDGQVNLTKGVTKHYKLGAE